MIRFRWTSAPIPFRTAFVHAAAERAEAENIIVMAEDAAGAAGFGEGCPRDYVTGETVTTACAFLARHAGGLSQVGGVDDLRRYAAGHREEIDANPSAFCPAELALLDLFGKQSGQPVEALLDWPRARPVRVSAIYGLGSIRKFLAHRAAFGLAGVQDAKLKLSGHSSQDLWRARLAGPRLRLDANNLWAEADEAAGPLKRLARHAWAIEEPLAARDYSGLAKLAGSTGLTIVLDESFTTPGDLAWLGEGRYAVNLRVSKLGGLIRTGEAIAAAADRGAGLIVGAQVGETSLLARAALAAAAAVGTRLLGFEAGYGTRLLAYDLAEPSIGFGAGGWVGGFDPTAPGLGLQPSEALLTLMAEAQA